MSGMPAVLPSENERKKSYKTLDVNATHKVTRDMRNVIHHLNLEDLQSGCKIFRSVNTNCTDSWDRWGHPIRQDWDLFRPFDQSQVRPRHLQPHLSDSRTKWRDTGTEVVSSRLPMPYQIPRRGDAFHDATRWRRNAAGSPIPQSRLSCVFQDANHSRTISSVTVKPSAMRIRVGAASDPP
jgi:hypothetical protein